MTSPPPHIATNTRRAAAIWCHHATRDAAGMNAVLDEACSDPDLAKTGPTGLIMGMLNLFEVMLPLVHTQVGVDMVRGLVQDMAQLEDPQ